MAVTESAIKNVCQIKLNNGTSAQGTVLTLNQNLGTLSADGWDAQKAMNVISALTPLLSKSVYTVYHVITNEMTD